MPIRFGVGIVPGLDEGATRVESLASTFSRHFPNMYLHLTSIELKNGEIADAGVVTAPDLEWSGKIEDFLSHQDELWKWQNGRVLRSGVGIDVFFYVLDQNGELLSIAMSAEWQGVGLRSHVWTPPERRRQGASSRLQSVQMEHFRSRGGRYLCLYTDYNSVAFRIYRGSGFCEVEPFGGHMEFLSTSSQTFEEGYFAAAEVAVETLGWRHWPTAGPLFMGDFPGRVRCPSLGLVGRQSPEYALLKAIRRDEDVDSVEPARVVVLRSRDTDAVVGLAAWEWHPSDSHTCLVDLYCHPRFWPQAETLLTTLKLPETERYVCYGDSHDHHKEECLRAHGFRRTSSWPRFPVDLCRGPLRRLPRSARGGRVAQRAWAVAHRIDAPLSRAWRGLVDVTGASARVPAKWPRFPMTRGLFVDLALYERGA